MQGGVQVEGAPRFSTGGGTASSGAFGNMQERSVVVTVTVGPDGQLGSAGLSEFLQSEGHSAQ